MLVCIVAGIAEELVYRGVMTELAQRLIGIETVTIVAVSISFAAALLSRYSIAARAGPTEVTLD